MTTTDTKTFDMYDTDSWKVDLPEGELNGVRIQRFEITEQQAKSEELRHLIQGTWGRRPAPGTYTKLVVDGVLWMSDTPAEVSDHREAVRQAHRRGGRVLINGLGLGMVLRAVLQAPNVEHVDVVEFDPDVAALVGAHYAEDPRVTIHVEDAHTIKFPPGTRWTVAWHDIWDTISPDDDESRARLNRRYGGRVDWQGGWAAQEAAAMRGGWW